MVLPLSPDVAVLTCEALQAQSTLAAIVGDRVYTGWPEYQLWPMITVDVIEAFEDDAACTNARVQVNCWGQGLSVENEREANLIARTVQQVSRDLRGSWPSGHIVNSAPLNIVPAPDQGWWRFTIDLELEVYP